VGGDLSKLSTSTVPDERLYRHSVAGSIRDRVPFVVTFATPEYCKSRTCGPVVEVVGEVAARYEETGTRFLHVEVYEDNDPANGFNRYLKEWKLKTEPWTFLVGADGKIVERFEGTVSTLELEAALDALPARE
jgi:glutathione peroxidase-family protein